jgi:acyl carrier protein
MDDIDSRVRRVMAAVFSTSPEAIDADASRERIENWTSLRHLSLVLALEDEFGVVFSDSQTVQLLSLRVISDLVRQLLSGTRP